MPQTSPDSPTLSICVPHNSKPLAILEETIRSAARAMPPNSELLVLPSGSEACKRLKTVELPPGGRVIASEEPLSMVSNWNRCLSESTGDLVHILHDDDVVEAGFYEAIIELHRRFSAAALYSTGFAQLGEDGAAPADGAEPALLRGDDAGRFLLLDERHEPGAVVVTRRVFREMGGFREEFPHSLDEEAFPRYASDGGLAFDPAPLYRPRAHELQTRHAVWRGPDFVPSYLRSRIEGASHFSPTVAALAVRSTARRVISVAVTLAIDGDGDVALRQLDALGSLVPECRRWPRFRLARASARFGLLGRVAALRRRRARAKRASQARRG